jgi:hypothetical protein
MAIEIRLKLAVTRICLKHATVIRSRVLRVLEDWQRQLNPPEQPQASISDYE